MKNFKDLLEDLHEFFYLRMDRVDKKVLEMEDWRERSGKYCELYKAISERLDDEGKKLLFEMDSLIGDFERIKGDICYRSGFWDGVRFSKLITDGAVEIKDVA